MVDDSPVVPSTRMASVPFSRWKSIRRPSASKSTLPSLANGVTNATMEPCRSFMFAIATSFRFKFPKTAKPKTLAGGRSDSEKLRRALN